MPLCQIPGSTSSYWLIAFDKNGTEISDQAAGAEALLSERILSELKLRPPTDIFLSSHGWKGDLPGAKEQYNRWFGAMLARQDDLNAMGADFRPCWIGLHWPSLPFGEESIDAPAFANEQPSPEEIMAKYVDFFDGDAANTRRLLEVIIHENEDNAGAVLMPDHVAQAYRELGQQIGYESGGPDGPPDGDGVQFDPVAAFEISEELGANFAEPTVLSGLLSPLRQLSFWTMKKRARRLGEHAMHPFCAQLQEQYPAARIHLIGHSFGCIVVSSILGGLKGIARLPRPVESLFLIQGAVSLWAFADFIKLVRKPGYFNTMVRMPAVSGPIVTTRSKHDGAVGVLYPLAVGLALQVAFDDQLPIFGGIGTWGIQGLEEAQDFEMLPVSERYPFRKGGIYNLECTAFIGGHSMIDGEEVAHAIWDAVRTGAGR
ncbi:hypothetical protein [Bradyrhizobium sp. WSM471]|uniref:hypothetical protein n=1 Tax=Bradyrhizobium sp. WSM471 TaxID=319017 RepID=UPI00024D1BA1|nr:MULTISPECIES: hypothetical protein [Bradyrhizobium]EHR00253.1 hypothetical protein Bra471DRAFT_00813 [Bradyrhizobium sp. WSM471]UFW42372.1 hypothetical protein BcanWSM471_03970 [Bradyrhizobium canariense]